MKAQDLKKSILQYAMQGKLVPQDPNDEPASELLKRIKGEKEQLIKDGKIKKEKPLPPITDEEKLFELPQGWEWVKLGEIGNWGSGSTPNRSRIDYYNNGTIPWLKTGDLNDSIINDIPEKITELALKETSVKIKPKGSLLIAMYGATIGKLGILNIPATTNQACCACQAFQGIEIKYLFYYLYSERDNLRKRGEGGAQPNISREKIIAYIFPLPPLLEQKRIVEKLEEILPLIDEYGKNEEVLSEMNQKLPKRIRQSILQYAVQGKLVPQDPNDEPACELLKRIKAEKEQLIKDGKIKKEKPLPPITDEEKPFELPQGWEWVKIRNIAFVTKLAGFEYSKYIHLSDTGEIPVIRAQNLKPFQLNLTNLKYIDAETSKKLERSALTKPCLLMTFIGAGIGDVAVFDGNNRFHLAPNVAKIEFYNNTINNKYAMYYLLSNYGKQEVFKFLKATAQPSLSMDTIREVMIPIPPLKEQKRIVAKVEELMKIVDGLEKG